MQLTLPHQTTKEEAIKKLDAFAEELMNQKYSWVAIVDPKKDWDANIVRFSFVAKKLILRLEFKGNAIITDTEAILSVDLPGLVEKFTSEAEIKENIKKEFNHLFNIK